jgi:hypothetical protein
VRVHLTAERFYVERFHLLHHLAPGASSVQEVHHPANAKKRDEKVSEALQPVTQALVVRFFCHNSHYRRRHKGEYDGDFKVRQIQFHSS